MSARKAIVVITLIVLAGAALRVPGVFTDFWLDEVWSLDIARAVDSPDDVLLREDARIDNNHPLQTWWMYALGGDVRRWEWYRLPALVCGIGSIIVAAHAMWRRGALESITAALLIAFSFPLVFYASEARGYAIAVFFAVVAYDAMMRYVDRATWTSAIVFNLACVLGFLAHLTFVHFFLAAMYWTVLRARRTKLPLARQLAWWTRLNGPAAIFVIVLFRIFVRGMTIGGASPTEPLVVLIRSLSIALGGFDFGVGAIACAGIAIGLFIASLASLIRASDDRWFFYLLAVVVAPGFVMFYNNVLSVKPQPLMPRYFLVAIAMLLLAIAHLAPAIVRLGAPGRVSLAMAMLLFVIANITRTFDFLREGRGGYTAAIARMIRVSPEQNVSVASDNHFRTQMLIDFYRPRVVPANRAIDFYPEDFEQTGSRPHPPEWSIVTSEKLTRDPPRTLSANDGTIYRLDSTYPCNGLSGISWGLYRIDIPATLQRQRR